jgi:Asparagine synthase (glutamine-hydrolyzing)
LDSSSIIATLHSLTTHHSPLTAFSSVFPGFEKDESPFAKLVADKFHLQHFTTTPDALRYITILKNFFITRKSRLAPAVFMRSTKCMNWQNNME